MPSAPHDRLPRLYVFSGAGLSAESGISTFRTGNGVWTQENIDDMLERAGALHVTHLHGDMHSLLCTRCDFRFPKEGAQYRLDTACPQCGAIEAVKPGVVFFNEAAPEYMKLRRMQLEMSDDDLYLAIGTTFEVVSPESMLPRSRWSGHERNFLIDPEPRRTGFFGHVDPSFATIGLRNLAHRVNALMTQG